MNKSLGKLGYKYKSNSTHTPVGMKPDYFIEKLGLIFEFDGPIHYQSTFKILKDRIKYRNLNSIELNGKPKILRVIRIPYYWQLTRDVAKYMFGDLIKHFSERLTNLPKEGFYSDEKYFIQCNLVSNFESHFVIFTLWNCFGMRGSGMRTKWVLKKSSSRKEMLNRLQITQTKFL